jgi:signal peptidase I
LKLGARWANVTDISYKRALLASLLISVVGLIVLGFTPVLQRHFQRYPFATTVVLLILNLVATWKLVQRILRTSFSKAILAWLPTLLGSAVAWGLAAGLVSPFLLDSFVVSTNAMAPTLLGRHMRSTCGACNGTGYFSPGRVDDYTQSKELGICGTCMRVSMMAPSSKTVFQGDHLLAAKFVRPERWDLIVFRYPEDPSIIFVKRLVGLPGEEVAIEDGDVWINGTRAAKPNHLSGLVYATDPVFEQKEVWGPVTLGSDEYFVLGDFSLRSKDSRLWMTGAPGHPAYAVPESHLVGVGTHIFWPPPRWRSFR